MNRYRYPMSAADRIEIDLQLSSNAHDGLVAR